LRGELQLPDQSDNPDRPSTLPEPDLNPLLNPVLARNIGRWAEVYFTNPPEKRERAVQELVRELERKNSIPGDGVALQKSPGLNGGEKENTMASKSGGVPGQGLTCSLCGYVNRPQHKFCGRCGVRMATATADARAEDEPQADFPGSRQRPDFPESPIFGLESTTSPWQLYRVYAGVALALIVLLLSYKAWRGAQATSGTSHVAPQAPPVMADTPAPKPPSQVPTAANTPVASPPPAEPAPRAEEPTKSNSASASPAVPVSAPEQSSPRTPAFTGTGFEELAMARDFLNGTNGKEPNRSLAAIYLWKAVAKQNIEATVMLSDLYLRGDGVPKNCEQARLLLDAAALKGRKDAAVQLRNLQAFGCQ
jgi:hypothetical protein